MAEPPDDYCTLGPDQMMCPRCRTPVKVNDTDLTWHCNECGYSYREFDKDVEALTEGELTGLDDAPEPDSG